MFSIFVTLIRVVLCVIVIYITIAILRPQFLRSYILHHYIPGTYERETDNMESVPYDLDIDDASVMHTESNEHAGVSNTALLSNTQYSYKTTRDMFQNQHVTYIVPSDVKRDRIVLDIPGGCFLTASTSAGQFRYMGLPYTIISTTYPTRFDASLEESIQYLRSLLQYITNRYDTEYGKGSYKITVIAYSAGVYLGLNALHNETVNARVDQFIGICGYYGYSTVSNALYISSDILYLSKGNPKYLCTDVNLTGKRILLITASDDFLRESTYTFARIQGLLPNIIQGKGSHTFFWKSPPDNDLLKLYDTLRDFIEEPSISM